MRNYKYSNIANMFAELSLDNNGCLIDDIEEGLSEVPASVRAEFATGSKEEQAAAMEAMRKAGMTVFELAALQAIVEAAFDGVS